MNSTILERAIELLKEEKPKIDYVLGMLETLLSVNGDVAQIGRALPESVNLDVAERQKKVVGSTPTIPNDEASLLDAKAKAMLNKLPPQVE